MKWEELERSTTRSIQIQQNIKTDIDCPECGEKVYLDNSVVLATYPVKYSYWCSCGWSGTSFIRWTGREIE